MEFSFCSVNGVVLPREQAVVSYDNLEYCYGFGVYEHLRVVGGVALHVERHIDRLLRSAVEISLEHSYTPSMLATWISDLLLRSTEQSYNVKILLLGAKNSSEAQLVLLPSAPHFPEKRWYRDGIATITVPYERFLPQAKTLNMLGSYLAYRQAKAAGTYDALLVDNTGCIREGTRTNVFFVEGETIISPPAEDILAGVTRDLFLQWCAAQSIVVREQHVPAASISAYSGAFLTSTSSKLLPIVRVDQYLFGAVDPFVASLVQRTGEWCA